MSSTTTPIEPLDDSQRDGMILRELCRVLSIGRKDDLLKKLIEPLSNRSQLLVLRALLQWTGKPSPATLQQASRRLVPDLFATTAELEKGVIHLLQLDDDVKIKIEKSEPATTVSGPAAASTATKVKSEPVAAPKPQAQASEATPKAPNEKTATKKRAGAGSSVEKKASAAKKGRKAVNKAQPQSGVDTKIVQMRQKIIQEMRDAGMKKEANAALLELQQYMSKSSR